MIIICFDSTIINKPRRIEYFELKEYDADDDCFDVYLENEEGERRQIASNLRGSGGDVSMRHRLDNPFKNFFVNMIIIEPRTKLGGVWRIDQALVMYIETGNAY